MHKLHTNMASVRATLGNILTAYLSLLAMSVLNRVMNIVLQQWSMEQLQKKSNALVFMQSSQSLHKYSCTEVTGFFS